MTLKLGRVTIPDQVHVTDYSGLGLSFDGSITNAESTYASYVAQIRGLYEAAGNPYMDELFVPVTWTQDTSTDAFYYVNNTSARIGTTGPRGRHVPWTAEFERVPGNPLIESKITGAVRSNSNGVTSTQVMGWHAVPASYYGYDYDGGSVTFTTRVSETGDVVIAVPSSSTLSANVAWSAPVGDYYDGACNVEDSAGVTMLGRSGIPKSVDNGLVRCEFVDSSGDLRLRISGWGGSWESVNDFYLTQSGTALDAKLSTARILHNRPEFAAIQLDVVHPSTSATAQLTASLRRGSQMVEVYGAGFGSIEIGNNAAETMTALDGGKRRSSNDSDGNVWVLAGTVAGAETAGNDYIQVSGSFAVGLGVAIGGTGAAGANAAQQLVYQWFAAQNEQQTLVQP